MRIAVVFSTGTALYLEPDKVVSFPDEQRIGGFDKRLHFSGGITLNNGETLERRLTTVLSRIRMAASESDLVVLPGGTYFHLAKCQRPQITSDGNNRVYHHPFDAHIREVIRICEKRGTHVLLGSFQEELLQKGERMISNTTLYVTPSEVKPIRGICGRTAFMRIPDKIYAQAKDDDYFYRTILRWANKISCVESSRLRNEEARNLEIAGRPVQLYGKMMLPVFFLEQDALRGHSSTREADIVAYMAADGATPFLDIGFLRNEGSTDQIVRAGFLPCSLDERMTGGHREFMKNFRGLVKNDGVLVAADCSNANLGIFYPFCDQKVQKYRLHSSGVYGILY
jgi:hypothetical protein